ncbi:hypothetical protein ACFLYU_04525 [Candidatus Dependentiae bacterium]
MRKNINNLFLLTIFCTFSLLFTSFSVLTEINQCCCPNTCKCPCECRHCYDCIKPCECRAIHPCHGAQFLQYRSQSLNKAKELVGWQPFTHRYARDDTNGSLYSSIEFTSSFRSGWIAQYLFGDDLVNGQTLLVQGSAVENRHPKAWLADYFGLPIDFESIVTFCPKIKNIIVDFNTYFGLNKFVKGLYLKIHFPIASTKWELNMSECIKVKGQQPFPIGYMSIGQPPTPEVPAPLDRSFLPASFVDAVQIGTTFGDQRKSMLFGAMPCKQLKKTRFSDIHATFGYDFILKKDYCLGLSLNVVFPTGNRPDARYLFEPIVGNGKHWELGVGLNSSWIFYRSSENENRHAGIWLDAVVTHMFKACQARSFDFCGKPNSRYALLMEMIKASEIESSDLVGTGTDSINKFEGFDGADIINQDPTGQTVTPKFANYFYSISTNCTEKWSGLTPAVNYTTRLVDVRINVQADIAIKFAYVGQDFSFDIGYNFWARTREKISPCKDYCLNEPETKYALKGDAIIWGRDVDDEISYDPLSGSQCKADIHSGQNMKLRKTDPDAADKNMGVDNPEFAWLLLYGQHSEELENDTFIQKVNGATTEVYGSYEPNVQMYSSFNPKLLSPEDLDTCHSASAITHKIFAHANYEWKDREEKWRPFAGVGGEAEFAPRTRKHRAISQWGIWLKAGVAFQ